MDEEKLQKDIAKLYKQVGEIVDGYSCRSVMAALLLLIMDLCDQKGVSHSDLLACVQESRDNFEMLKKKS